MRPDTKNIFIFILIIASFVIVRMNFDSLHYLNDSMRSFLHRNFGSYTKKENLTIINTDLFKNFGLSYIKLEDGFIHSCFSLIYQPNKKISINEIADMAIGYTEYHSKSELIKGIKKINGIDGSQVSKNNHVMIPRPLPSHTLSIKPENRPKVIYSRGLYLTGITAGSRSIQKLVPYFKELGINTIVFDAKDVTGIINYRSRTELVRKYDTDEKRSIDNLKMFLRVLRENEIFIIARVALFHDQLLYARDPSLAIQSRKTGKPWRGGRELWCDPTNKTVQDYNLAIAEELADIGVDEIQFDYIRFPTSGELDDARFAYSFGKMKNEEVITHFLERAYKKISSMQTLLSIDIFGVVAWAKEVDINSTGQRIESLSRYCDIISPMLYPSHFDYNFDGRENPADQPYYFIFEGTKKVLSLSAKKITVRPWLQAFRWRVSNYDEKYILDQIDASDKSGGYGYLFWNASNSYDIVFDALNILKKERQKTKKEGGTIQ